MQKQYKEGKNKNRLADQYKLHLKSHYSRNVAQYV